MWMNRIENGNEKNKNSKQGRMIDVMILSLWTKKICFIVNKENDDENVWFILLNEWMNELSMWIGQNRHDSYWMIASFLLHSTFVICEKKILKPLLFPSAKWLVCHRCCDDNLTNKLIWKKKFFSFFLFLVNKQKTKKKTNWLIN